MGKSTSESSLESASNLDLMSNSDVNSSLNTKSGPRLISVANRLPFSLSSQGQTVTVSSGGLVSALSGAHIEGERIWLGSAPNGLTSENWPEIEKLLSRELNRLTWTCHPLFVPPTVYNSYYNGTCNDVLWPLLHYQPEFVDFNYPSWHAYREVNELMANEIAAISNDDDLIWIHDFHLFLVPSYLRRLRPKLKTGFFLHVPFPSSEVFRQLPVREEILSSLLDSNLIGFHDYSYLRHFSSTVLRLLGIDSRMLEIEGTSHTTHLGVFPVSIDSDYFMTQTNSKEVRALAKTVAKPYFQFLGVDRLDYIKGIDLKLKAFAALLRTHPEVREQVGLLQVAVPTRPDVPIYNKLAHDIAGQIGEINGEFSTPNWTPIQYIHANVQSDELIALYREADALIVSSKRDGMNLVALEYVASQDVDENPGVLLLSEFTGAVSALSHTLSINPWDIQDFANKLFISMRMPKEEKTQRIKIMQEQIQNYTATDWAQTFIKKLNSCHDSENSINYQQFTSQPFTENQQRDLLKFDPLPHQPPIINADNFWIERISNQIMISSPQHVTLFLDYDGTLVPIRTIPELAVLPKDVRSKLRRIIERYSHWLEIVIISGRTSEFLFSQFESLAIDYGVHLAAEHGAKYFDPHTQHWNERIHRQRASWYPTALKIMSDYAARVPASHIERKSYSIAWHYRQSPREFADFQSLKLAAELEMGLANLPVGIIRGKCVIEVRASEADKGVFAHSFLEPHSDGAKSSFALAFGDDRTDEDLYSALIGRGCSIKIGLGASLANFALISQSQLMPFLECLLATLDARINCQESHSGRSLEAQSPGI
jgi:trehalose 6-phosphate synthase/phosphatase